MVTVWVCESSVYAYVNLVSTVGMLDAAFVDCLDVTLRVLRGKCHSEKAFGGIQLIFSGDSLQLPCFSRMS